MFKKHFMKKYLLRNNVEKYARIKHGIHVTITRRMRVAC